MIGLRIVVKTATPSKLQSPFSSEEHSFWNGRLISAAYRDNVKTTHGNNNPIDKKELRTTHIKAFVIIIVL